MGTISKACTRSGGDAWRVITDVGHSAGGLIAAATAGTKTPITLQSSVFDVEVVRNAVEMILDGAPHGAVYSYLERKHNELKNPGMEYHQFTG